MSYYVLGVCGKRINVEDLSIYSTCPLCGKEVDASDDFWELVGMGIDPCRSNSYCRCCGKRVIRNGGAIRM